MIGNVVMDRIISTMDKFPGKNGSKKPLFNTMMSILGKGIGG
jgi:hypothetical protein